MLGWVTICKWQGKHIFSWGGENLSSNQAACKQFITKKSSNQTTTKNPIHKEKHLTTKQQTANNCKTTKIIEKKNPLKILCNQPSTKPEPILMVLVQYLYSILTIHSVIRLLQNHYMLRIEICLKNFFVCLSAFTVGLYR